MDIGHPGENQNEVVYSASFEDSSALYVALTSYDALGNSSAFSNEILVAAAVPAPPPPPPPAPVPDPEPAPEPDPQPVPQPPLPPLPPQPGIAGVRLGITADPSGLISTILSNGDLAFLTLDSLAANRDIRPDRCDLDGDGDDDLVIGFGTGGNGQVAVVTLEDDAVISVASLVVGDASYHVADGQTYPACGDIDGDGRVEIVVGMGPAAAFEIRVFDDSETNFANYALAASNAGRFTVPTNGRIRSLGSAVIPSLGDIDGDGRAELVVGFGTQGIREIAILDDGLAQFAAHPRVQSALPLVRIARSSDVDSTGGGTYPALGDWDGDGLDEIAIGFGPGSGGWVAMLDDANAKDYSHYSGYFMMKVGDDAYRTTEGASRPVFGNVDTDEAEELLVGFVGSGAHRLQIFDDLKSGGMTVFFGGLGYVASDDPNARWIASPSR